MRDRDMIDAVEKLTVKTIQRLVAGACLVPLTGAGAAAAQAFPSRPVRIVVPQAPDGYNLLLAYDGTHAINASLYKSLPFDTLRDFSTVATLANVPRRPH